MNRIETSRSRAPWIRTAGVGALLVAVSLPALGAMEESTSKEAGPPVGSVVLIDPGEAPRRELRLRVSPGDSHRFVLVHRMSMEQGLDEATMAAQRFPTTEMPMSLEVTAVAEDGAMHYTGTYGEVSVHDEPELDPRARATMEESMQDLAGARIHVVMDNRGFMRSFDVDTELVGDPMMAQMLETMKGAFEQMSLPLPAEPVGAGARWRYTWAVPTMGMDIVTEVEVTLSRLTDTGYEGDFVIAMSAEDQAIEAPNLPPGASVRLVSFEGEGIGTVAHDLSRPIPLGGSRASVTMEIEIEVEGQRHSTTQRLATEHEMREGESTASVQHPTPRPEPVTGVVTAGDGVPIVYEARGIEEPAVIFVHCWACDRSFWKDQIGAVEEAGYRVVALDLPGHGDSGAQRESWSIEGLAADVETVVDSLGIERMILVGHSLGGPVSLEAARRMPERVAGIVCVDTLHDVEMEWPEGMTERMAVSLEQDFRAGIEAFAPQLFRSDADPELVAWVVDRAVASDHAAAAALMRAFEGWDPAASLAAAGTPVRCINAAPADGEGFATEVEVNRKHADFEAVLMEGVGHYPQLEQPEAFNAHLLTVLEELASPR